MTTIQKQLGGAEDLLSGVGPVEQPRNGVATTISSLYVAVTVDSVANLGSIDTAKHVHAKVVSAGTYQQYVYVDSVWRRTGEPIYLFASLTSLRALDVIDGGKLSTVYHRTLLVCVVDTGLFYQVLTKTDATALGHVIDDVRNIDLDTTHCAVLLDEDKYNNGVVSTRNPVKIGDTITEDKQAITIGDERYAWDSDNANAPTSITETPNEDGSVLTGGEGFGVQNKSRDLREMQLKSLNEAERRLRQHEVTEVSWYGDSNSERNSSATVVQFRLAMQKTYPNFVVRDRARSGMTTHRTFAWESGPDDANSILSIINLGTNDALWDRHPKDYGVLTDYAFNLRALVSRQIMRGHGIVLVSPLPQRIDYEWAKYNEDPVTNPFDPEDIRPDSAVLTAIMKQVADEFGCKFVDLREIMQWYGDYQFFNSSSLGLNDLTGYGDPIHLDLDYSHTWGRYVAAAISCGNLNYTYTGHADSEFQFRKGIDPVAVSAEATRNVQAEWRFDTGRDISHATSESNTGGQHRAMFLNVVGDAVTWSFYVPEGGVCVTPVIYLFDPSVVRFYWNTGSQPLRHMVDPSRQFTTGNGWNNTGQSVIDVSSGGAGLLNTTHERPLSGITSATVDNTCHLLRSGWHSITLELSSGSALFSGLIFSNSKSKKLIEQTAALTEIQSLTAVDMDDITTAGKYFAGTDSTNVPPNGGATSWVIDVSSNSSESVVNQVGYSSTGVVSMRQRLASVWSSWSLQS